MKALSLSGLTDIVTDSMLDSPSCDLRKAGASFLFFKRRVGKSGGLCFYLEKREKKRNLSVSETVSETVSVSRVRVRVRSCVRSCVRACIRASLSTSACSRDYKGRQIREIGRGEYVM